MENLLEIQRHVVFDSDSNGCNLVKFPSKSNFDIKSGVIFAK